MSERQRFVEEFAARVPMYVVCGRAENATPEAIEQERRAGREPGFTTCADCQTPVVYTMNLAPREPEKVCQACGLARMERDGISGVIFG